MRLACAAMIGALLQGGCVAAAIPVVAGAVTAGRVRQDRPSPVSASAVAAKQAAHGVTDGTRVVVLDLKELPPPSDGPGYADFAAFALERAFVVPEGAGEAARLSAVLDETVRLPAVRQRPCGDLAPAVVIDLDPGAEVFAPSLPGAPQPGLAGRLTALRAAGVTVMWASALPVDEAQAVYDRLRETGLDPAGVDRLLLSRRPDERKQARRLAATRDWCILAIAGDRNSDFDELFDYLRDENYASPLAFLSNAGWFIAPPPIQPTATENATP